MSKNIAKNRSMEPLKIAILAKCFRCVLRGNFENAMTSLKNYLKRVFRDAPAFFGRKTHRIKNPRSLSKVAPRMARQDISIGSP